MTAQPMVHLVDDDAAIRDALAWLLRSHGLACRAWADAESFLADYRADMRGCLILDIRMRAMTGLELHDHLRQLGCPMPVIFLTGHGDVPQAVAALKKGAYDFLEKPFDDQALVERIHQALARDAEIHAQGRQREGIRERLEQLTERERAITRRVLTGKLNKQIADELEIAVRTVEVHRAHVFEKMGVKSAVELARLLGEHGLDI